MRIGQYLKNDDIPVVFTGIYNSAIIADFENDAFKNFYATCYAPEIKEQFENTVLKLENKLDKIGVLYRRGELQAEIQYDDILEYTKKAKIKLFSYEIQEVEDFEKAKKYFIRKGVKWIYIGTSTVIASSGYEQLSIITDAFPTICMLEDTVLRGGLSGYVIPWDAVTETSVKMALDILDKNNINSRVTKPSEAKLFVNRKTAQKLNMIDVFERIDNKEFV
jgi:putative ABC transport system substrate-binding protein